MTRVIRTVAEARQLLAGRDLACVPTMGALHEGHLSLVRIAREHAAEVVVTIFVNPLQFGPGEDFERYPRAFERDLAQLEAEGVEWVFAPSVQEMYPDGSLQPTVFAGEAGSRFEGAARPGHFDGMLTVVRRLLQIIEPRVAVFGLKDAQQLALIKTMVREQKIPVQVVSAPISREADGLARSSRNVYLNTQQRAAAPTINRALERAAELLDEGAPVESALAAATDLINAEPELEIEYLDLVDPDRFEPLTDAYPGALLITVVRAGSTRLLDNLELSAA